MNQKKYLYIMFKGLYHSKAKEYVEKNRLSRIAPDMIMKIVAYCNELGFDNNSLLKKSGCFTTSSKYIRPVLFSNERRRFHKY
jgi:hypothetical protein